MSVLNNYKIKGSTVNGDLLSPPMGQIYERGYASVIFYTDDTYMTPVIPSAGTVRLTVSETGVRYGTVENGTVDATADQYDRPNWAGAIGQAKATFAGITGASHVIVTLHRFGG